MTKREDLLQQASQQGEIWDVLVIGGGATGLGAAVEAAARGYRTLLVERYDFAKGTSSRSTKLVHGGVRYLEQMNVQLVLDALRERGHMLRNAPHLVHDLSFVVPAYNLTALPYYGFGLKMYDWLSGKLSLGRSELLSAAETQEKLPGVVTKGLRGGILYHDGQFDDARYAITLLRTLEDLGGVALNYVEAKGFIEEKGKITGIHAADRETDGRFDVKARVVINACGAFSEETLRLADGKKEMLLSVSQGTHIVLPHTFLPGAQALMIPKTADGRVLFAIPWHGATIVGTTDVGVPKPTLEPRPLAEEMEFLFEHIERYFGRRPRSEEVLSVWSGLRPLVRKAGVATSKLSRDHSIQISADGLVTVTGGKWTTYRRMGQDTINRAAASAGLAASPTRTLEMKLHGWDTSRIHDASEWERVYGSDLPKVRALAAESPTLDEPIHPRLPFRKSEILWAARNELARTTEDILARRTRALFLDARAAIEAAPAVAHLLGEELHRSEAWIEQDRKEFQTLAKGYLDGEN